MYQAAAQKSGPRLSGGGTHKFNISSWLILIALCCACWLGGWKIGQYYALSALPALRQHITEPQQSDALSSNRSHAIKAYTLTSEVVPVIKTIKNTYSRLQRCDDSCFKARDGVCQDGRLANNTSTEVLCDLGSDCSDCGPYNGVMMDDVWFATGPIDYLKQHRNAKTYTRHTITQPPFQMLYTSSESDLDVSAYISSNGILEAGITKIFETVLKDQCVDPETGRRRLVLDVGANFGYFSVYAAKLGCRVIAWEPVPHFRAFMAYNLAINNVTHLVSVRPQVASDTDKKLINMLVPTKGIWGTASVVGMNKVNTDSDMLEITVCTERIDSVVKEEVLLMKVDVEGFEPLVMQSANELLTSRSVENIVFEYSPGIAERTPYISPEMTHLIPAMPQMLLNLLLFGYQQGLMLDHISKGGVLSEMPSLPQIQPAQVVYDIQDAQAYYDVHTSIANKRFPVPIKFNCPPKPELIKINQAWVVCDHFPEAAHPKSVRSSFYYNTNIWASLTGKHIRFLPTTPAVMQLKDNARRMWSHHSDFAVGARSCLHLPLNDMVIYRCPCDMGATRASASELEQCRAEQALVDQYLDSGVITFQDNEHATTASSR